MDKSDKKNKVIILLITIVICALFLIFSDNITNTNNDINNNTSMDSNININNIPPYSGNAYIELNDNIPEFKEEDFTTDVFENYSDLDKYERCGVAFANICKEIMPKEDEERGDITHKPTGWVQNEYPYLVNTRYLYNRCHLIGWQLGAENNNKKNLITGTAYLNQTMRKWEDDVAEYINNNEKKNYHVLYRVTPIFEGNNLLASGVHMEAMSVEERQKGIYFNIYIYNVQPNIAIDYETGENYEKLLLTE